MFESFSATQQKFLSSKDIDLSCTTSLALPMRSALREEWLRRLNSGSYQQCTTRLRKIVNHKNTYCCLGVMCDIATTTFPDVHWGELVEGYQDVHFYFKGDSLGRAIMPPDALITHWFPKDPEHRAKLFLSRLALCNDHGEFTFTQIADLIDFHTVGV